MQNMLTSILPGDMGFNVLTLLNGVMCASTNFAPVVVARLGPRLVFFGGSFCITIMLACTALTSINPSLSPTLFGVTPVAGFFLACMWSAQPGYCSSLFSLEHQGLAQGMFFSIFSTNGIWAFLLLLVLLQANTPINLVLWAFFAFAVVAALSFIPLRTWHARPPAEGVAAAASPSPGCLASTGASLALFQHRSTWCLAALAAWAGNTEGLFWGSVAKAMGPNLIAVFFFVFGCVSTLSSSPIGKLSDSLGRKRCLSLLMFLAVVFNITTGWAMSMRVVPQEEEGGGSDWAPANTLRSSLFVLGAVGFGMTDLPAQGMLRACYKDVMADSDLDAAFAGMLMCELQQHRAFVAYYGRD
jgi:MFS family permease